MMRSKLWLVCSLILKATRLEHFVRHSKMIQWHFSLARKDFHGLLFRKIAKLCGAGSRRLILRHKVNGIGNDQIE